MSNARWSASRSTSVSVYDAVVIVIVLWMLGEILSDRANVVILAHAG
jgi:hypothetical protein